MDNLKLWYSIDNEPFGPYWCREWFDDDHEIHAPRFERSPTETKRDFDLRWKAEHTQHVLRLRSWILKKAGIAFGEALSVHPLQDLNTAQYFSELMAPILTELSSINVLCSITQYASHTICVTLNYRYGSLQHSISFLPVSPSTNAEI